MEFWHYNPYMLPLLLAGFASLALVPLVWRRRVPGAVSFCLVALLVTEWTLGNVLEMGAVDLSAKLFWANTEYVGIVFVAVGWLVFVLQYTGNGPWLTRPRLALLLVLPVITLALVWTNDWHGLMRQNVALDSSGPYPVVSKTYGAWFWVSAAFNHAMCLAGSVYLLRQMVNRPGVYRRQIAALAVSTVFPWLGNLAYLTHMNPIPNLDWTPIGFALSAIMTWWALFHFGLLDVVPIARDAVVESIGEGVIVIDAQRRVVDVNPAAQQLLGRPASQMIGSTAQVAFARRLDLLERYRAQQTLHEEVLYGDGEEKKILDLTIAPLRVRGLVSGHLVTLRDVTERKRMEETLSESEERYRRLVELSPEAIYIHCDGRFVFLNAAAARQFGATSPEQLVGRPVLDVISPQDRALVAERIRILLQDGTPTPLEQVRCLRMDGSLVDIETVATSFTYRDRPAVLVVARDITERKRAEQEVRRRADEFAALVDITRDLSVSSDLPVLLETIAHKAIRLLHAAAGGMYLYDAARGDLRVVVSTSPQTPVGTRLEIGEGMAGRVAATRRPLIVDDYRTWAHRSQKYEGSDLTAVLEVPMLYGGELIGVLVVEQVRETEHRFDERDERLLSLFAAQAAGAVYNARLFAETKKSAEQFAALYEMTTKLSTHRDVPDLLHALIDRAKSLIGASCGFIYLHDPERNDLELAVTDGMPIQLGVRLQMGEGLAGQVAETRQPLIVADYQVWENRSNKYDGIAFRAVVEVPMVLSGALTGVLGVNELGASERQFTEEDAHLLALFASQAASIVHNARLLEQTSQRAEQLELLYDAGLTLNRVLDPSQMMDRLLNVTNKTIGADQAGFFRFEPERRLLTLVSREGHPTDFDMASSRKVRYDLGEERGLVGQVAAERTPIYLPDLHADPRWVPLDPRMRSGLWVPVAYEDHLHGVLVVTSKRLNAFTAADQRLAMLFANQLSVALENAYLFSETRRRVVELETVNQVSVALRSAHRVEDMLPLLLEQALAVLKLSVGAIYFYDLPRGKLRPAVARGWQAPLPELTVTGYGADASSLGEVLMSGQAAIVRGPNSSSLWPSKMRAVLPRGAGGAVVPISTVDSTIGILIANTDPPREITTSELKLLTTIAEIAGNAVHRMRLHEQVENNALELASAYEAAIEGWSHALDLRDHETEGHCTRVTELTVALARALGVSESELIHIRRGALLHDIGKMGVPDRILLKPGPLTADEWQVMRQHPMYAQDMLMPIPYLRQASEIPYCHHEKWDGSGYPRGLQGEEIPLAARIFAVVDVWDALRSDRPYRAAWSEERAVAHLRSLSGTHFEPRILETFVDLMGWGTHSHVMSRDVPDEQPAKTTQWTG